MKLPDINEHTTPDALLKAVYAYIDAAEGYLDTKNMVDLAGLDSVVDVLCSRVLKVTKEEHARFADAFEDLHQRLGALQEKMITTQAVMKEEIEGSTKRQRATHAYRKGQ